MSHTIIPQEKLTNLKDLANRVDDLSVKIKEFDNIFIESGFTYTDKDYRILKRYKKLKKEYQKKINEIIKKL